MQNNLVISITDGVNTRERKLKQGVSIERAAELLEEMYASDYLGLSYTLLVNGREYMTLES